MLQSGYSHHQLILTSLGNYVKGEGSLGALGIVTITQIDSDGNPLETWTLWNSFIEDVKFGDSLSYGDDELNEVSVTLKYDWARVETTTDSQQQFCGGES